MRCPGLKPAEYVDPISTEDMRAYEVNAVWRGVSLDMLMENAGAAVAGFIECALGGPSGLKVAVVAGKGGNGGDGMAAARRLASRGAEVDVHLVHPSSDISHGSAARMLEALRRSEGVRIVEPRSDGWLALDGYDVLVDAVLGIGVRGRLRSPVAEALAAYNSSQGLKVSVDVPSGVDPDSGEAAEGSARSDYTIAMHAPKKGLLRPPAAFYAGEVLAAEIGIPGSAIVYSGPGDVAARIPVRRRDAWKGSAGRVSVVGGSELYAGAPIFSALAAYAAGVDLVYLVSPRSYDAAILRPELVPRSFDDIESVVERSHAVVVGPGIGVDGKAASIVERVLDAASKTGSLVVMDADAVKLVARGAVKPRGNVVLTPHRGEARELVGSDVDPLKAARAISEKTGVTTVVKAPVDAVCEPSGRCRLNDTGAPEMSVGGTGDVLAGVIAGFAARRIAAGLEPDPLNTAAAALHVVGVAGEKAVAERGESITPTDVIDRIPAVIRESRRVAGQ